MFLFLPFSIYLLFFILKTYLSKPPPVYLVDFSCFKPPPFCRVPFSSFLEHASMIGCFDGQTIDFMGKVLSLSGHSQETYLPPALHYIPPRNNHQQSIQEVHMVLFPVMEDLLSKTKIFPCDIDILIVNCSGFCPSPSLSSIIINKYSMRSDIKSYNISGMGCSAGVIGIDLAQNLLGINKDCNAVVLSTEILSTGWYPGNEKSMLVLNCNFRMGSAAVLLTNKNEARKSSKYKLSQTLRTQRAFDDKAYFCAQRKEDSKGITGFRVNRCLMQVVGETLRSHITAFGSSILPYSEKFRFILSIIRKRYLNKSEEIYVPSFKSAIQHFCLPASGKPWVREIAKGLKLSERDTEAALMTLHRFGNQSSSSFWYELAYIEGKEKVKKGDKVWQLGLGSGMKCNSVVWECIRPITGESKKGPWADCIHRYPIVAVDPDI
ncbi:hypothetical protein L1049_020421 [Liquidambar formosana]|uniref:3-ketoacyl-CoA synthase n=1 Tax=Liquidambar formosana TaxID=63359 RepID=A0AAP0X3U2_LIQFO